MNEVAIETRVCRCGETFTPRNSVQVHCSEECRADNCLERSRITSAAYRASDRKPTWVPSGKPKALPPPGATTSIAALGRDAVFTPLAARRCSCGAVTYSGICPFCEPRRSL